MRHYCALNFRGLTSFACLSFSFKVFHFQGFSPFNSRPVLHYEVFKVPLCFSATACLVYTTQSFLSRTFSEFFKFFFVLLLSCCSVSAAHWLKKSGLLFALFSSTRIYYSFLINSQYLFATFINYFFELFAGFCSPFILRIPARLRAPDG
jgi:hypothetical protein